MRHIIISILLLVLFPLTGYAEAVEIDGIYYNLVNKAKTAEVTKNPNNYTGSVTIPSSVTYGGIKYSVTSIADNAFNWCSNLTVVTIPNSVTSIGKSAFSYCSGLTSVTIPNSVTYIGSEAFWFCSGLTSVTIPNNMTYIGSCIFYGCRSLISVTIPNSVTSIGVSAFYGCSGLTSVTIPNSVTYIGGSAFSSCSGLTSITIPNSVTSIESYTFSNCSGLTSVTIPNSVTYIDNSAFIGCIGLTSVTIPNSVTYIGSEAFGKCKNITDVYCWAEKVSDGSWNSEGVNANANAFKESYPEYITLHVPGKSIDAYKAKEPWYKFKEILALDGTALAKITIGSQGLGTYSFDQDLDFSGVSGIEVYVACGFNPANSQILLMKVQDAPAGTGLYVKTTSGKSGEFVIPVKNSYSYYMNMLKPVFASTTVPTVEDDYTNYVLTNGTFTKSNGMSELEANSAYLQFPNKLLSSSSQILSVSFVDDVLPGDVNGDGRVNVADIVALNKLIKSSTGSYSAAADLNNDGKVNYADVSILVQMIMGR